MTDLAASTEDFLYEQIAQLVTNMIETGTLTPGDRVPSLRRMSEQLKVSIATVMQAYVALEEQGLIEVRPQSGFYVRPQVKKLPSVPKRTRPREMPRKVHLGDMVTSILSASQEPGIVPLGAANPALDLLPVKGLTRALTRVASQYREAIVNYAYSPGSVELCRQIAFRGVGLGCQVSPEEVVITNGATEAMALSLKAVAKPGDVVAVESPTYFTILQLIEDLGMLAVEVPTEADVGMCLEALESILEKVDVKAVISVGNFNNPMGSLMPDDNKARLVGLLAKSAIPLIEDDIYGDLYFGEARPRNAKCFDEKGLVLTCSSFSKTLAPGYRVGWVIPGRFQEAVMHSKQVLNAATASLPQLVVAEFLQTGSYDRHLRRLRKAYREQVDKMRYMVGAYFPDGTRVTRPRGGFVLWVEMPRGLDSMLVYQEALSQGISLTPGALFSPTQKFKNFIRLNCGNPWNESIERGVIALGGIAHRLAEAKG